MLGGGAVLWLENNVTCWPSLLLELDDAQFPPEKGTLPRQHFDRTRFWMILSG